MTVIYDLIILLCKSVLMPLYRIHSYWEAQIMHTQHSHNIISTHHKRENNLQLHAHLHLIFQLQSPHVYMHG